MSGLAAAARGLVLALLILFVPAAALAAPKFPPLTGRVVDDAHLLSPQAQSRLTDELAALEQQTGHQVVVVTLPSLQGYEIEDYGYQLLRTWGVGRKEQNDGIILIVAPNERKVRIEVGYGLEPVMTDALSKLIIERAIVPAFKAGDMEKGVVDGTEAIIHQIGLPEDQAKAAVADAEAQRASASSGTSSGGGIGFGTIFAIFVAFWVLSGVMRLFGARLRGTGLWWLAPLLMSSSRRGGGSDGWSGGGGGWSGGGGGFSGGGGSGGGGGASGSW